VNTTIDKLSRRPTAASGVSMFIASLDSASLPDMGDRSLDQETHTFIRPRRRKIAAAQVVMRRSGLPFPEPRLPDLGGFGAATNLGTVENSSEVQFRQVEENAGLRFIRGPQSSNRVETEAVSGNRSRLDAKHSQGMISAGLPPISATSVRNAYSGPIIVAPPLATQSALVSQPMFDMERQIARVQRTPSASNANHLSTASTSEKSFSGKAAEKAAPFASLEENIARISQHSAARIAVLAIGVSEGAISRVGKLSDNLRERFGRSVEILAAEQLGGLRLASSISARRAGEVSLVVCEAQSPRKTLPFLSQFDGVILMVEIGQTQVADAAAWADALRGNETSIVGVWAA
jgi:hypothetical protein